MSLILLKEIGESFICDDCVKLKTLEHGPIKVGNVYSVRECKNLVSLKGLENTIIPGIFNCSNCYALESLEGCPKKIGKKGKNWQGVSRMVCCFCTNIKTLKGAPEIINGDLFINNCASLESLEGCPKQVTGSFVCYGCKRKFEPDEILSVCDTELTGIRVKNITL